MASKQEMKGDWNQISGFVKEKYGEFTDDALRQVEGNSQKLIAMIQEKTGQGREQIEAFVHDVYEKAGAQCSHLSQATSEFVESTGKSLQRGYEQTTQVIAKRPAESVVAALVVGLIGGVMIGLSVASARRPEPTWRNGWRS